MAYRIVGALAGVFLLANVGACASNVSTPGKRPGRRRFGGRGRHEL